MRYGEARQISSRRVIRLLWPKGEGSSRGESADGAQMGRQTHQGPKGIFLGLDRIYYEWGASA